MPLDFALLATTGRARRGRLRLPHGVVETPAFMPVGTLGAVKGLGPEELEAAGAEIQLANLYHLSVRPGIDVIERLGGLHAFTGWRRPHLTDSGGFQVMSLAGLRRIDDQGVTFRSHLDGDLLRFTPAQVVRDQRRLGVDIAMALDECPPWPAERRAVEEAVRRTGMWARQAREAWPGGPGALFGIVQGGVHEDLRRRSLGELVGLEFDGYAIGGVSVGEPGPERRRVVDWVAPELPAGKPRYLMGVGTPADLAQAVLRGVDLFDCVLPSRNARHGVAYAREGVLRLKNSRFRDDGGPLDPDCRCAACRRVSRAFLHHLVRAGELSAAVLLTQHNLRFYLDFMADLRKAIESGSIADLAPEIDRRFGEAGPSEESTAGSRSAATQPFP